ncbi:DUF3987 domain-containing protein [Thermomonospora cellulosilytica]|uniref:DNA helicase DnaB-like N-terminal domain-containing protein n=1 Tax=Thermomonospora cellulosilytica TaxID=1411118 RepID=A0A7W3MUC3_9ACTN|nr:DUF3987 domain-containing protein [Thermomonospora cellulosilytica]MBA9002050.1 hypothetical protein [Thermomonospora cellulosilytica]
MTKPTLRAVPTDPDDPGASGLGVPHSIEAEQFVLGAVMLSPATLAEVRPLLDGSEFYRPAHQTIWQAICALADRGAPADPLAVGAEIGPRHLAKVGGAPYLHTLISRVPAAANGTYYAHMVRDLAYARTVVVTGTRLAQLGREATEGAADLRAAVAAELAALTATDARGWPDPTPLSSAPQLPRFPIWCLPDWAGEYAASVAEVTQTPPDLAGCLALAVLALAAGGNVQVNAGTWVEPTNLYVVVVLPPGNRKSEVYKAMTAPIRAAEHLLIEEARPRIAEAVIARRIAEADAERTEKAATETTGDVVRQAEALAEAAAARLKLEGTPVPAEPKLFGGNDSTVEKVASRLAEQGGRFAVLAPEGGKLFAIAGGQYSGGRADMSVFLSGHAGEEIRVDRMGRPSEVIDAATLTIGICLQPGVLTRLGETPEFREQGLLGRLLISVPESLLGYRDNRPQPIPPHVAADYERTLTALVLSLRHVGDKARESDPPAPIPTLTFTPEAQDAVIELLAATEPRFRPGSGDLAHMTDWGGKLVGATVRIAALLHLGKHLRNGWDRPIDLATWNDAVQLGEYFTTHAQAAYDAIGADPAVADARAVLDWLRRTATQRFTARDLMRGLKHRFAKVTDTDPALRVLESHGWIRRIPAPPTTGRGRPAAPTYEAHPDATQDTP